MGNCCGFPSLPEQNLSCSTNPSTPGALKNSSNNTDLSVSATTSSSNCRSQFSQTVSEIVEEDPDGEMLEIPNLKVYTFSDMKAATKNFKTDSLGQGGFGKVFKGWVDEKTLQPSNPKNGMLVAIKKLNPESMQGYEEWQSEVNFLGRLSHPNLVKLLGYCLEEKELLLVYEFMAKGSLENHLFRRNPAIEPLSWDLRMKIAVGAAKGLAFLHTSDKHVIYRDFKASNILLDSNFNAKISDFGLARLGPSGEESHVTTRIMGTYGYAAPEYVATGHLYVKSDVFGFGVVLLEMMTGLRALDTKRPNGQQNLVDWLKPCLPHKRKIKHMMDARIQGQYSPKAAWQAAELTLKCLEGDHRKRPSMKEVVDDLEKIEALKLKGKEKARPPGSGNTSSLQQQHAWSYAKFRTNNGS